MVWVSPTGDLDGAGWLGVPAIYDEDVTVAGVVQIPPKTWSAFVILTHAALNSNKLRFYARMSPPDALIDLDVFKDGAWVHVYEGTFANLVWVEKGYAEGSVTKVRVRFWNSNPIITYWADFYEFDFWEVVAKAKPANILPLMRVMDMISAVKRFPKFKPRLVA